MAGVRWRSSDEGIVGSSSSRPTLVGALDKQLDPMYSINTQASGPIELSTANEMVAQLL